MIMYVLSSLMSLDYCCSFLFIPKTSIYIEHKCNKHNPYHNLKFLYLTLPIFIVQPSNILLDSYNPQTFVILYVNHDSISSKQLPPIYISISCFFDIIL